MRCKTQNDLKLYKKKEIGSTFCVIRNTKLLGAYKHLNVPVTEFANECMGPLLENLSHEKKEIILMGDFKINILNCDFKINILNCDSDTDTTDFVDTIYVSLHHYIPPLILQLK